MFYGVFLKCGVRAVLGRSNVFKPTVSNNFMGPGSFQPAAPGTGALQYHFENTP